MTTVPELTYTQLRSAVADLRTNIARGAEAIRARAVEMSDEAQDTGRVAEMVGAMRVDTETVGETRELSRIMHGLSDAVIEYAGAADTTARQAGAAYDQAQATHGGIQEAVSRSPVSGIHEVDRDWFRQE